MRRWPAYLFGLHAPAAAPKGVGRALMDGGGGAASWPRRLRGPFGPALTIGA